MKHCRKVKDEQLITFQMAQQIKTKNTNVVPGQLSCRLCKAKSLLKTDSLYWWSRQFPICYRYWQWIHWMSNTKDKVRINWRLTCQLTLIYEIFKEQYFWTMQSTSWLFERFNLILMIKMIWNRKWMTWLGCTRQCKKNWNLDHIYNKSKFLPWYQINGLECTVPNILTSLNILFELHVKSKSR